MNRESERKRLVELLKHECDVDGRYDGEGNCPGCKYNGMEDCSLQELADHLLDNGIVVPLCKVGQTVYYVCCGKIFEGKCHAITIHENSVQVHLYDFDGDNASYPANKVFTSREEAEKMLVGKKRMYLVQI